MVIDKLQIKTFLEVLYPAGINKFLEFRAIGKEKKSVGIIWLQSFKNLDNVIQDIGKYQQDGKNIYVGINARNKKRGRAENIKFVNCLWIDLDGDRDTSSANLNNFTPKPSIVVDSGNGLHAYWIFKEPQPVSDIISSLLRALAHLLDGDSVYDYSRVMRLPGTFNLKDPINPKLCKVIKNENNLRYTLADFKFLTAGKAINKPNEAVSSNSSNIMESLSLSFRTIKLINRGNDGTYPSRSEADLAVIIECLNVGLSDEEIEEIFSNPVHKIGEKYRADGNHYLKHTIKNAKKMISQKLKKTQLNKYAARAAREIIIESLKTETIYYNSQFYQYEAGYYKPIIRLKMEQHISDVLAEKISKQRLDEQIKLLQVELGITRIPQKDDLFCFQNGTYSLERNKLEAHSPDHFLFNSYPYNYDPFATCPTFMNFLDQILLHNKSLINFIQLILGYCLSWDVSQQVMFFFFGNGENGKSTLLEVFREISGRKHTLEHRLEIFNNSRETHHLLGIKLLIAGETSEDEVIATERLKNAISGETIVSNPKYRDPFTFKSKLKIIVSTNHFPLFRDKTVGMKRRVLVIPFRAMIPANQKKLDFFQKDLVPELPGIFNFALEGLRRLQKGKFVIPNAVKKLSATKFNSRDSLSEFVHNKCMLGPVHSVDVALFYSKYSKFCKTNRINYFPKNIAGKKLKAIDPNIKRKHRTKIKKNDTAVYTGIKVV